jgi:urease accessory protein
MSSSRILALLLAGLPVAALAHSGHGHGFSDGLIHPFLGADHLLAMLLVGVWSVLHARRVWVAPLCFVSLLAIGALLGGLGWSLPQLEPLVAGSVLVLGVMLTLPFKLRETTSLAVIGAFALCHGLAHGGELSAGGSVLAGIVLGSALLHAAGMGAAQAFLKQRPLMARRLGQLVAVVGGGLLLSAII